jgi:glycosyltransferase involved in cell wall biosynthesis
MNVLFLGYWNLDDPLTKATIYPNLKILQGFAEIEKIMFVNTERKSKTPHFSPDFTPKKISYYPLFSANLKWDFANKFLDFLRFPKHLTRLVTHFKIDLIIARSAPAGALAYLSWRKTRVPFLVESFEPHADYMLESGIWRRFDLRYIFQKKWEKKQKEYAIGLLPVAENYARKLVDEGISPSKIKVAPCSVDFDKFFFDPKKRESMRTKYDIGHDVTIGIYAGKYGGLYLEEYSFKLYTGAFQHLDHFHLIILSPVEYHNWIYNQLDKHQLPPEKVTVRSVSHEEVPHYLSMSDFAFATYRPGRNKAYLSPVKIGEYWACGLPVVLTRGVGDESDSIDNNAGVLFGMDDLNESGIENMYSKLKDLLINPNLRSELASLVRSKRNPARLLEGYRYFFQQLK